MKHLIALIFASIAAFSMAQPAISNATYSPHSKYTFVRQWGNHTHPDGYPVTIITIQDERGRFFRVLMRSEQVAGLKEGDQVDVKPTEPKVAL